MSHPLLALTGRPARGLPSWPCSLCASTVCRPRRGYASACTVAATRAAKREVGCKARVVSRVYLVGTTTVGHMLLRLGTIGTEGRLCNQRCCYHRHGGRQGEIEHTDRTRRKRVAGGIALESDKADVSFTPPMAPVRKVKRTAVVCVDFDGSFAPVRRDRLCLCGPARASYRPTRSRPRIRWPRRPTADAARCSAPSAPPAVPN